MKATKRDPASMVSREPLRQAGDGTMVATTKDAGQSAHRAVATASRVSRQRFARSADTASCPHCAGTGAIWVVCPDAGAVRLACSCQRDDRPTHGSRFVDAGLATALVACCGVAFLLL
jgi:hypothetical protein